MIELLIKNINTPLGILSAVSMVSSSLIIIIHILFNTLGKIWLKINGTKNYFRGYQKHF